MARTFGCLCLTHSAWLTLPATLHKSLAREATPRARTTRAARRTLKLTLALCTTWSALAWASPDPDKASRTACASSPAAASRLPAARHVLLVESWPQHMRRIKINDPWQPPPTDAAPPLGKGHARPASSGLQSCPSLHLASQASAHPNFDKMKQVRDKV